MNDESDSNIGVPIGKSRKIGWLTDKGKVRETDEDCVLSSSFGGTFGTIHLFVVADGMGGHAKGEVASKKAISSIPSAAIWVDAFSRITTQKLLDDNNFKKSLEKGIKGANDRILEYTAEHPEASGMGTTSVCAIVRGNEVTLANVGDSRAYVVSDTKPIEQVTTDHSLVQELVDKGEITEAQARDHPSKNVITRAVGLSPSLEVDIKNIMLKNDESLLLCCDGVIAHLSDDDIQKIVLETPNPQDACRKIVDMTNDKGGSDNISLIILSKPSGLGQEVTEENKEPQEEMKAIKMQNAELQHQVQIVTHDLQEIKKDAAVMEAQQKDMLEELKDIKKDVSDHNAESSTEEKEREEMRAKKNQLKSEKDIIKQKEEREKAQSEPDFFKKGKKT